MYLRRPVHTALLACLLACLGYALHPAVTTGILAGLALVLGAALMFVLDAASRRGRSAARRWKR